MSADRLQAIKARAAAARQALTSGTTGSPPNIDGLSIHDALYIVSDSAQDVDWLVGEVEELTADRDEQGRYLSVANAAAQAGGSTVHNVMRGLLLLTEMKATNDRLAARLEAVTALLTTGDGTPHGDNYTIAAHTLRVALKGDSDD